MTRERQNAKYARYRKSIGDPLQVPVGPVAVKLRELRRTMLLREIQDATGISYHQLTRFGHANRKTVPVDQARILLAFQAPVRPTAAQRCTGTRRILQGLSAMGFTGRVIAEETGLSVATLKLWRVLPLDAPRPHLSVSLRAYEKLVRVAQKLEVVKPEAMGVRPVTAKGVAVRARSNGYPPLSAWEWDTIADPDVIPEWTGRCGSVQGWRIHRAEGIPFCPPCTEAVELYGAGVQEISPVKLREFREKKGMSKCGLAGRLGCNATAVAHWETGRSTPLEKNIKGLLSVLDCSIEDLTD